MAKERGLSPVQLQKCLFVLGKELPAEVGDDFYDFIPYNYGPFDRLIYRDATALSLQGLLAVSAVPGQRYNEYSLTPSGITTFESIKKFAPSKAVQFLESVVHWAQGLSFSDLVRAIYEKYPEYKANS